MQKLQLLIIFFLVTIFIAGCTGGKIDNQSIKVGDIILNRDMIKTIVVNKATYEANEVPKPTLQWTEFLTFNNSSDISLLIGKIEEISVKKLTNQEDDDFMKRRIKEEGLLEISFYGENNSCESLKGEFLIWPDGYVYTVDVNSMRSSQRTIAYLSELKYPEIYKWLTDKADANNSASAAKILTQIETAEQFVKSQGYQIIMDSGANFDFQMPSSFDEIMNGVHIGDLLKKRNELSKQNGLDFSSYLGKQVTLITYAVENKQKVVENIDLIMDGNKIVGFWIDNHGEPPDFNVIVSAFQSS